MVRSPTEMPPLRTTGNSRLPKSQPRAGSLHSPARHTQPSAHTRPQLPQLFGSSSGSTQVFPHSIAGGGHSPAHTPSAHISSSPHSTPQLPQCFGSTSTSTQSVPHSAKPASHSILH